MVHAPFHTRPGWSPVATAYESVLATPPRTWRRTPIPWEAPLAEPLLDCLTAPRAHLARGALAGMVTTRPDRQCRLGSVSAFVPATFPLPDRAVASLLDDGDYAVFVLQGALYAFGTARPLPPPIADAVVYGLQEGWIHPVRLTAVTDQSLRPCPLRFPTPPLPPNEPGTLDLATYVAERERRWSSPLTAALSLRDATYAWLSQYPALHDWLQEHAAWLEPSDLRLLAAFLQQLSTPARPLTPGQVGALQGMVQGILGEVLHRACVWHAYQALRTNHPHATLLTERELCTPRGLATSDAVIGTIDADRAVIALHAVYELTSETTPGRAPERMAASVQHRFADDGITVLSAAGAWRRLTVDPTTAPRLEIVTSTIDAHETLHAMAADTVNTALAAGRAWLSVVNPDQPVPGWMMARAAALIAAAIQKWSPPHTAAAIAARILALQTEFAEYLPAWTVVRTLYDNFYGLLPIGRRPAAECAARIGLGGHGAAEWERRFRGWFSALGLEPASIADIGNAASRLSAYLRQWVTAAQASRRVFASPQELLEALEVEVRPLAHEAELFWPTLVTIFGNYFAVGTSPRRSHKALAAHLPISTVAIGHWERRLERWMHPLGCAGAKLTDARLASIYAHAALERWSAKALAAQRSIPDAAALLDAIANDLQPAERDWSLAWPIMRGVFADLFGEPAARLSFTQLAVQLTTNEQAVAQLHQHWMELAARFGITPPVAEDEADRQRPDHVLSVRLAHLTADHLQSLVGSAEPARLLLWSCYKREHFGTVQVLGNPPPALRLSGRQRDVPDNAAALVVERETADRWRVVQFGGSYRTEALTILRALAWLQVPSDEWLCQDREPISAYTSLTHWPQIHRRAVARWQREFASDDIYLVGALATRKTTGRSYTDLHSFAVRAAPPDDTAAVTWIRLQRQPRGRQRVVEVSPSTDGALTPMLAALRQAAQIDTPSDEWLSRERRLSLSALASVDTLATIDATQLRQWARDCRSGRFALYIAGVAANGVIQAVSIDRSTPDTLPKSGVAILFRLLRAGNSHAARVEAIHGGYVAAPRVLAALRRNPQLVVPSDEWLSRGKARGYSTLKRPEDFERLLTPAQVTQWAGRDEWNADRVVLRGHTNFDSYSGIVIEPELPATLPRGQFAIAFQHAGAAWRATCYGSQRTDHQQRLARCGFVVTPE